MTPAQRRLQLKTLIGMTRGSLTVGQIFELLGFKEEEKYILREMLDRGEVTPNMRWHLVLTKHGKNMAR